MPTSEANTAALNTNTALGTDGVESSKANVCVIMTQDQCLDNVHQTESNIHSANDQVSDDLNNSKNNIFSNGVNNVQEFNVDVNSKRNEHSANVAIVQNCTVDVDSPSTGKVLTTSEHSATESCDFRDLKENLDNLTKIIDASERASKILLPDMTVITHQNSSENIRDIIASSDKINKVSNESHLTGVNNNVNSGRDPVNTNGVHKSGTTKKKLISSKSKLTSKGEIDKPEDPVERLNKLRASISSALSEVKGVLKQYSTEQSFDGENESTPSSQPSDDGPVRFRFVRKIRRRSVFSEDDTGKVPENRESHKDSKSKTSQVENIIVEDTPKIVDKNVSKVSAEATEVEQKITDQDPSKISKKNHQNDKTEQLNEGGKQSSNATLRTPMPLQMTALKEKEHEQGQEITLNQKTSTAQIEEKSAIVFPTTTNENTNNLSETKQLTQLTAASLSATPVKPKTTKPKKLVKKDRRASIAAVEINQVLTDKLTPLELTTQRRPSDSGTLVKQTPRIKAKTNEKINKPSQRQIKTLPVSKTEIPSYIASTAEPSELRQPIIEESNNFAQNTYNSPTASHSKISTTVSVNDEAVNIIAKNQLDKIEQSQTDSNKEASAIDVTKNKIPTLPLVTPINNSNDVDVKLTQISSESGVSNKLKTSENSKLVSHRETRTDPISKTNVVSGDPTVPTIVQPTQFNQSNKNEVKMTTLEKPKESDQTTRNSSVATSANKSTPLTTELPVLVDDVKTVKVSVAQNQPKTYELNSPNPPETTPEKTLTPLVSGIPVKVNPVNVIVAQNQSKPYTPITSIPLAATLDKASTPFTTPIKLSAVNTLNLIARQNPSDKSPNTNALKAEKKETPTIANNTDQTVSTANLLEEKQSDVFDIPIMQIPEVSVVTDPIKSDQSEIENSSSSSNDEITKEVEGVQEEIVGVEDTTTSTPETTAEVAVAQPKKKKKAKRKVVIRRIKRKLSKDDTFIQTQEAPSELEICEKEIEEKDLDEESEEEAEEVPKQRKSCLKARQFEIGDIVMYAERYKKTQVKWRKATVIERITSISYKLDIEGDEKPAHISYIKKFTDRKVNFGGKEYLEIDYAQIEEDEEKERNYSIWNHV